METPTLLCAATGLMAFIVTPTLKRVAKLFKRLHFTHQASKDAARVFTSPGQ